MTEIEQVANLKKCESCGEEFGCGSGSGNCWCFNVETEPAALERLAASFNDCICPKCLASIKEDAGV